MFLSGGIDSSAVTALMSEVAGNGIKTYSIGFKEKSFDELDAARIVADKFGTDHTEFVVTPAEVSGLVPTLAGFLDEPLADASVIPTYVISKLARHYVTVALAGDGGDELFGGYDTYKAFKMARWYRNVPGFIRRGLDPARRPSPAGLGQAAELRVQGEKVHQRGRIPARNRQYHLVGRLPARNARTACSPAEVRARMTEDPFAPVAFHAARTKAADPLDRIAYLDLKLYLQDDLLPKVDRMSMAASLEIRAPFLDYTFVEFAATIPSPPSSSRAYLQVHPEKSPGRPAAGEILNKKKIGFDIPLGAWMRDDLKEFVRDTLAPERLRAARLFRRGLRRRAFKRALRRLAQPPPASLATDHLSKLV